uniref:FRG domain-containing protein n=1 Tax=Candidatus Kentrum sp. FW TaxID=2126338 RepID=A0A450TMB3_9GAMM|nr:MAG: FRG domain-containing protein [Candidatus Kentron sp. FW]
METLTLNSWRDFSDAGKELHVERKKIHSDAKTPVGDFLFRGQANAEWPLSDTLERSIGKGSKLDVLQYHGTVLAVKSEIELFTKETWDGIPNYDEYQERLRSDGTFPFSGLPAFEYMVHLRHHGFPSPLLDWTRSLHIAAFFAFDEIPPNAERVAIHAFIEGDGRGGADSSHESGITIHRLDSEKGHRRHFLQRAEYSTCTLVKNNVYKYAPQEEGFTENGRGQHRRWKITLPVSERDVALKALASIGITPYSLFESEESLMKKLGRREFGGGR